MESYIMWSIGIITLLFLISGIRIVRPVEVGLIERLGKYKKTAQQGFHWIIPYIEKMIKVNMTENMADVHPQKIITRDDLNATVDAVVYFRVKDAYKATYNVDQYKIQLVTLAKTTLRDIIGKMTLSDANNKRDAINSKLESDLDKQTAAWGIDVIRVELQRIEPPNDVQESMNKVVKAEREKIAAVNFANAAETKADGERRAKIKSAEGVKQSLILEAEGRSESIIKIADARAKEIEVVNTSLRKHFKDEAKQWKAYETAQVSLKDNTKYVIDGKSSVVNVLSDAAGQTPIPLEVKK